MHNIDKKIPLLRQSLLALALSAAAVSGAQAATVNGTIHKATDPVLGAGTTIDYWAFTLSAAANVIIDVRAGTHTGFPEYASSNRTPLAASASICGVFNHRFPVQLIIPACC